MTSDEMQEKLELYEALIENVVARIEDQVALEQYQRTKRVSTTDRNDGRARAFRKLAQAVFEIVGRPRPTLM